MYKRILSFLLLIIGTLILCGCKKDIILSLNEYNIELTVGETYEIKVNYENIELPVFTYRTLDEGVITIENNIITAISKGSSVVKIGIDNNEKVSELTLYVKVKNIEPAEVISTEDINIQIGETSKINYEVKPDKAVYQIKYISNNKDIAKVSEDGVVTGISGGTTTITISVIGDTQTITKDVNVTVKSNEKPIFKFSDKYVEKLQVNWNDDKQLLEGITVEDVEDGDITNNIEITNKEVIQDYGKQVLVYKAKDSDGNEISFEREIEVIWNYDVQFIGHAGSYFGIMNSEEAIMYAITNLKYQAIEIDLKQTKDGVFVLSHDDTFGDYQIANTNWNELKDVEITKSRKAASAYPVVNGDVKGDGVYTTKICSLQKYLQICKQYNVTAVIELKSSKGITNSDQSRMQALMDEIEKENMLENVIFLGSQYNCLIWTRQNGYEYIPCQYLVNSCESETYLQRCIDYNLDISINVTADYTNGEDWLARYKDAGLKVSTYTYTQYVNYDKVQEWIDKGVDYVTCDWHQMANLKLHATSNEPVKKFNVTFLDQDGTILKQTQVKQGNYAPAPSIKPKNGYNFIGWDNELKNIQSDMVFTAQYELIKYSIIYNANADKVYEEEWTTKEDFKNEFYNDLFDWIKSKGTSISGLSIENEVYTFTRNEKKVTFKNANDIIELNVYDFEKTISNLIYKPVTRNDDGTCIILNDNDYFLNSDEYMIKYQGVDQWLYNCIKTSYTSYDTTYTPKSDGRIQIFFRMHQWMKGTKIQAFDAYPKKYRVEQDNTISPVLPTIVTFTVEDEFDIPSANGNKQFLGWYTTSDCTGSPLTKIEKGTIGDIVLYAKWAE